MSTTHYLAAILPPDMAGYRRLMQNNQAARPVASVPA